ncbi:hypothetical protein PAT3040_06470 [Paenibacillus agaridevorans]|uniref:Uncharacterized protein n=1 Tax=Paenibacillus agaridevorans TaxID=171404 RepID=A0A2R5F261_9BACL|nr:hypothetical protein PAT3040_06470 [Paenibacillus agaridevorans]
MRKLQCLSAYQESNGALNRDRTGDLILTMDALYLLSYESIWLPEQDSNL